MQIARIQSGIKGGDHNSTIDDDEEQEQQQHVAN